MSFSEFTIYMTFNMTFNMTMCLLLACVTCVFPDLYMCVWVGRVFSFDCCFGGYKKIVEKVHSAQIG